MRQATEKSEGNALFAEEILSFLTERGVLRVAGGKVGIRLQSAGGRVAGYEAWRAWRTARVDRLARQDRALLQAAAVIGRRFDPQLLAVATDAVNDVEARLASMQALDLVYPDSKSGGYSFKHALVRDALYQSLLTGRRAALHLKIAEEIERRSGNRLTEVAETLAFHYSQTNRADKAFEYLSMSGSKSLGVYSFDEANNHFAAAIALVDKNVDCASEQQIANLLVGFTLYLNLCMRTTETTEIVERFKSRLNRLDDTAHHVMIQHHYVMAFILCGKYQDAEKAQSALTGMVSRGGGGGVKQEGGLIVDPKIRASCLSGVPSIYQQVSCRTQLILSKRSVVTPSGLSPGFIDDSYIRHFTLFVVGWEEFHRGRIAKAHEAAIALMSVGQSMNDPRSIGYGKQLQAWTAVACTDFRAALDFAETAISIAAAP